MLSFGIAFGSFVSFHVFFRFFTQMDPEAFWPHEGVLFMMKQEVVKRGWLPDAQSLKKLKGEWKKVSTLGMHLTAKYSGARAPKFANVDLILPVVVVGKREEAARTILNENQRQRLCVLQTQNGLARLCHALRPTLHNPNVLETLPSPSLPAAFGITKIRVVNTLLNMLLRTKLMKHRTGHSLLNFGHWK